MVKLRGLTGRVVVALALFPAAAETVGAQDVRAYLSQAEVAVGEQFVLNVEVSGTQQLDADPMLPDLSQFAAFLGSGSSTSMRMVGGRTSVSLTIQYRYQATATGAFDIGPVSVPAAGQQFRTEPLTIRITNASTRSTRRNTRGNDDIIGPDDLFVTATVSKAEVHVNEAVVVEYRLFTRVEVDGYSVTNLPSASGFWVEELTPPQEGVQQVVRDGVQYASVVLRRVAVFPTSPGPKTITPLTLEAQVRVQRRSRRRGIFDDPFFGGGLFGSRVPVVVASEAVELDVRALPPGQPASFSGLVGQLGVTTSVDKTAAAVNEALTYRVEVAGTSNIRTLPEPALGLPAMVEVYPPEVSERVETADAGASRTEDHSDGPPHTVRSFKTFEYVVVPRAPGQVTLPAVTVSYFDVDQGAYATASSPPIELTISGDVVASSPVAGGRTGIDLQREDIRFIRTAPHTFQPMNTSLTSSPAFWATLVLPLCGVGVAVATRRHRDRLLGDVAYARRRRASRMAKRRLATASSLRAANTHREFYAEVSRALQGFLGDTLNLAAAGLMRDDVRGRLLARGATNNEVDMYLSCLDDCDRLRFAPEASDMTEPAHMLTRAEQAMAALEQSIR